MARPRLFGREADEVVDEEDDDEAGGRGPEARPNMEASQLGLRAGSTGGSSLSGTTRARRLPLRSGLRVEGGGESRRLRLSARGGRCGGARESLDWVWVGLGAVDDEARGVTRGTESTGRRRRCLGCCDLRGAAAEREGGCVRLVEVAGGLSRSNCVGEERWGEVSGVERDEERGEGGREGRGTHARAGVGPAHVARVQSWSSSCTKGRGKSEATRSEPNRRLAATRHDCAAPTTAEPHTEGYSYSTTTCDLPGSAHPAPRATLDLALLVLLPLALRLDLDSLQPRQGYKPTARTMQGQSQASLERLSRATRALEHDLSNLISSRERPPRSPLVRDERRSQTSLHPQRPLRQQCGNPLNPH